MKTYVKSIRWKRAYDGKNKDADRSPHVDCTKKCEGVDCASLKNWLSGMDEAAVEWEVDHYGLTVARMICRTVVWIVFFSLLGFVAWKWNGAIGCKTDTGNCVKCSCKEAGK